MRCTGKSASWTCPSVPYGMDYGILTLPVPWPFESLDAECRPGMPEKMLRFGEISGSASYFGQCRKILRLSTKTRKVGVFLRVRV
jgi:hypothetical protein